MEKFNAIYEEVDGGWIGYVEELPGANTQGKTKEEVRENLKEAIQLTIEANRELARDELKGRHFVREELVVAV